jgi:excisionase family DNA binding protein
MPQLTRGNRAFDGGRKANSPLHLITVPETAHVLRITRKAVYDLLRAGRLPYIRVGRRIRIDHAALMQFVQQHTVPAVTPSVRRWRRRSHATGSER